MTAIRMRASLEGGAATPRWPPGVHTGLFGEGQALSAHTLLTQAYAGGFGQVPTFEQWWTDLIADAEFDPALCLAAYDASGHMLALAQCWTSNFVKDLVVSPERRREGLGGAMLLHVFNVFRARGASHVDLKVDAGNAQARAFYARAGMFEVKDRASPG